MNFLTIAILFFIGYLIVHAEEFEYFWLKDFAKLDRGRYRSTRYASATHKKYLELLMAMSAKLCRADGAVQMNEIDLLRTLIDQKLNLKGEDALEVKRYFSRAKDSNRSFESYLDEFHKIFGDKSQLLELAFYFLQSVAKVGGIHSQEDELLGKTEQKFNIHRERYQSHSSDSHLANDEAYRILGCRPGDSFSKIKKHYRKKVVELHPDKLNAQGMPAEMLEIAKERFLKVQEAYEQLERQLK